MYIQREDVKNTRDIKISYVNGLFLLLAIKIKQTPQCTQLIQQWSVGSVTLSLLSKHLGRSSGSCRSVGFAENWKAAPGWIRLAADRNGILQDEGGKLCQVEGLCSDWLAAKEVSDWPRLAEYGQFLLKVGGPFESSSFLFIIVCSISNVI